MSSPAILNKVHFAVNLLSMLSVAVSFDWELEATMRVFPYLLPVNVGVLLAFGYFYSVDLKEEEMEGRYSSFGGEPDREMHRKIYVNEGKYFFYFNWGANVFSKVKHQGN